MLLHDNPNLPSDPGLNHRDDSNWLAESGLPYEPAPGTTAE